MNKVNINKRENIGMGREKRRKENILEKKEKKKRGGEDEWIEGRRIDK